MAEQQQTYPIEVPTALSQLIAVNVEYKVVVWLSSLKQFGEVAPNPTF